MITGNYPYRGATISGAVVQPLHLQIGTHPWGLLWFDCNVWASLATYNGSDGPIERRAIVRLEGIEDAPAISKMLADHARSILTSGVTAADSDAVLADAMISAAHLAMDDLLLAMPEFTGWTKV